MAKANDYGFRIYNPGIGRFLSVDPLTSDYPAWSPYPFAMNRPIDGVDLDGLEWDKATDLLGKTTVSVNVNFLVDENLGLSSEQIREYQNGIHNAFNRSLQSSFGNMFSGVVTFYGGNKTNQVIPTLAISNIEDRNFGGMTTYSHSAVSIYKKDGSLKSPAELGAHAVHELLHTLRLDHPFEITQGDDTRLIHQGGFNYSSTSTTDRNLLYNIMNYNLINIDNKNAGTMPLLRLTNDQLNLILNEIDLQKQGYGREGEGHFDYWIHSSPGIPVPRKD